MGEVKGVTFCDQYAKRTCCSDENFTDVKRKYNINLLIFQVVQGVFGSHQYVAIMLGSFSEVGML